MKAELEDYLWNRIDRDCDPIIFPRQVIIQMLEKGLIVSPKQAWRTLEKWCDKQLYEYGTSLDLGWKLKEIRK